MLRDFPREVHRLHLFGRGHAFRDRAEIAVLNLAKVRLLDQHSAKNALEL